MVRSRIAAVTLASSLIFSVATLTHAAPAKSHPDLSGEWRFDPSRSDRPDWGRGRPVGEKREGMSRRPDGPPSGGKTEQARRGPRLPSYLRIEQASDVVRLIDSTGTTLTEISTAGTKGTSSSAQDRAWAAGKWKGDRLEVERDTPRGKATQTFSLTDDGRTLEVTMQRSGGSMGPAKFKRVYQRLGS